MLTISKYKKLKSRYLNKNAKKIPFRSDLFNIEQLGEYASILAREQKTGGGTKSNYLLERLNDNDEKLQAFNKAALSLKKPQYIYPATEWLVDNFYLIEEHIQLARKHFPKSYSRELPTLTRGPYKGLPRIYSLAVEVISHVDAQIDEESLLTFFSSYQQESVLKLGELWAIPIMLRLVLIENLQRIATKLQRDQQDRQLANDWMSRIEKAASGKSSGLLDIISEMAKANIPLSSAFVSEFSKRLSIENPSFSIVRNWLDQRLQDEGLSSEEMIHMENQFQAADQVSVSHSIKSLRFINSMDWKKFVEGVSIVEAILRKDAAEVYGKMDFSTRDHYRHVIERLAQQGNIEEQQVASLVVSFTEKASAKHLPQRYCHVGYYLIEEGIKEVKSTLGIKKTFQSDIKDTFRRLPLLFYGGTITLLTIAGAIGFGYVLHALGIEIFTWKAWILMLCFLFFISQIAVFLVNWLATLIIPPDVLPRLDFSGGIPYDFRSVIVIPTIISSEKGIHKLLSDLEIHYLSNRDPNLYFGLLTDFADADKEHEETDASLLDIIHAGIENLNRKYCSPDNSLFYLFHRPRLWNAQEKKWMGYERKRGKLMAFNHFLREGNKEPFSLIIGNMDVFKGISYVITLDADTQLPPYSVHKLVGTMAHILNRPVLDPERNIVVKGYGILQPRIAINLRSSRLSGFSRLFTDEVGIDPYTRYVSDVYQDIFHEGSFVGKGIYDVSIFEQVLDSRFPENKILSHDLLESAYTRSGLLADVEVYESYPFAYLVDVKRRHRWIRGDWQIIQWLLPKVPVLNGYKKNPLSVLSKWKIADNLRRSLLSFFTVFLLVGFLIWLPDKAWVALTIIIGGLLLPFVFASVVSVIRKSGDQPWSLHLREIAEKGGHQLKQILFSLMVLPYDAWICTDAIVCSLWRLLISHKHLLQWQTSEDADRTIENSFAKCAGKMWFSPLFAIFCCFLSLQYPPSLWYMLPLVILWLAAPLISCYMSLPVKRKGEALTKYQEEFLYKIARKTWHFFEVFVSEKDNWLPPDNFQEIPDPVVASRTSPTNIGLSLLAALAACDFGYISVNEVIDRTKKTLSSLTQLKKFRGHFYNWYDTKTLEPLFPLYISTVDSGNLAGNLIALAQGLEEYVNTPVYSPVIFEGLLTTVRIMRDMDRKNTPLKELEKELSRNPFPDTVSGTFSLLLALREKIEKVIASLLPDDKKMKRWGNVLLINCLDHMDNLLFLYPWINKDYKELLHHLEKDLPKEKYVTVADAFLAVPSIHETVEYTETVCLYLQELTENTTVETLSGSKELYTTWLVNFTKTSERAQERKKILNVLALQSDRLANMDFRFLYDEKKNLFTIGYNVIDQRFDAASYDILASEARLSSYLAIAQGQVPIEHWFSLSRLVILVKGKPVLLSWSGSMFEYLMPLLMMPTFEETLMDITYQGVIEEQIGYAEKYNVPWGISESGYNRTDMHFNYQYQAFGIPSLGLKRGLSKDLVIAPYATMLGLMVDPRKACENMERLSAEGHEGNFGYYEAIDYTPSHLPINEKSANIFSFMAHHQGMGFLALVNVLKNNSMQRRFMACPLMKAFELLLQERVPHSITANLISDDSKQEMEGIHALNASRTNINRLYHEAPEAPEVNLLSNGRYQVMINSSGAGYSRWNNLAVTRWRKDVTSDRYGLFIYMKDMKSGKYWSAGFQPTLLQGKDTEVRFTQAYAEYRQRQAGLEITTTVCVSPEDDVELRCIKLINHTHKAKKIEFTTFSEVVIAPQPDDEAHTVFSNLFVQTTFNPDIPALFCTRRPRSENDRPPYMFHLMVVEGNRGEDISFETDRSRFIGRGNTLSAPLAMQKSGSLSGSQGSVLDPAVSLRQVVTIPPGKSLRVCVALGIAETEETISELAEKYQNIRMTDRAFELAWTHNQVVLYNLNLQESDAQLFQKLAGALVYMNPALRADAALIRHNRKGQNGLWGYAISGDYPLVLVKISHSSGMELVKKLILAHAYWRIKGLVVELVILNEDVSVYRHPLHEEIINLVTTGVEASLMDKSGGIFVRPVDQMPAEDLILLQAVASVILTDKNGSLQEQIEKSKYTLLPVPDFKPSFVLPAQPDKEPVIGDLIFNNGLGGFTKDGKEYVITLNPGDNTPAPWSNVIANPSFGTVLSESGGAYTWAVNAHEFRLTPWYNDPVKDTAGEAIYIRDEHTGKYWSPSPLPARGKTPYTVRHGFGYSVFEHAEYGIESELWMYVDMEAPVKFSVVKVRNTSGRTRRLSVTGFYEWVLGDNRTKSLLHTTTQIDVKTGVLFARNYYNTDFAGKIAFVDAGGERTVTGDRFEFIGPDGSLEYPRAMKKKRLSGKVGAGMDPCGAVQVYVDLQPGEQKEIPILLGYAENEEEMLSLVSRFRQFGAIRKSLENVWKYWNHTLGTVHVETPDASINVMANGWLLYQTLSCRIWARSGYYQSGGAYGFRDQLQDVMALVHAEPALVRQQILLSAHHQFRKGDVQHWWHPPVGRGVRTHFSDDYLWLPYVTHHYITAVGDTGILDEMIPFIEGRELAPEEESYYDLPWVSDESGTLYEHCVRSIRYGLKFGQHGLPLIGCGDWNDGMNLIGEKGKGESVWLAFFLYDVLMKFSDIATRHNDPDFAGYCQEQARHLRENIRRNAWDGKWYRRAYFDDGTPLGSRVNKECTIDVLPQSWSVISGAGDEERSRMGMQQVNEQLVNRKAKIIQLFNPPFDKFKPNPGYIKGYIPGVRENGGQYTHGTIWTILAFALMGETERAWELFSMLNPIHHGSTKREVEIYKAEPYVIAADVYSASQHLGRGGWTWYTGSSAWMYRVLVETLLGINRFGNELRLTPQLPEKWDAYKVHYRHYDTFYHISFVRIKDNSAPRIFLDGVQQEKADTIYMVNDQKEHDVEMWI